jgi:hypothetical protein
MNPKKLSHKTNPQNRMTKSTRTLRGREKLSRKWFKDKLMGLRFKMTKDRWKIGKANTATLREKI